MEEKKESKLKENNQNINVKNEDDILKLVSIEKNYGKKKVLKDINFSMKKGEIIGLIGPNGAGKSTIMGIITGLIPKYEGQLYFNGKEQKNVHFEKKKIGAMIEDPIFFKDMTGIDNLKYCSSLSNQPFDMSCLNDFVERLEMEDALKEKVKTYSVGMKKKLDFLQALHGNPDVLILDEPTSGMDPEMVYQTREILKSSKEQGCSILISSHQLAEIGKICDRIIILQKGEIIDVLSEFDEAKVEEIYLRKVRK